MPHALVAVIRLEEERVGVLPFPEAYAVHVKERIEELGELVETVDFPEEHTKTLPKPIISGQLDGLVCKGVIEIKTEFGIYNLFVYQADAQRVYQAIKRLSPSSQNTPYAKAEQLCQRPFHPE